ncbi:ABC transporter substrate-binding protein [Thioalkalivibrio versutus]|uniref:ABC transporter substrate-binding protein n=1 Tax=Thioalkalivibrio versutus TaxID=106634 RepID=A0A0G3FZR4_9GAMM|nr:transporter substrate-binding domain-containing protein [Thioalkalivibrio versutus]AKJ94463.1 ABC transporter substrate-binding protein [Thioalkalivibrio versutus]
MPRSLIAPSALLATALWLLAALLAIPAAQAQETGASAADLDSSVRVGTRFVSPFVIAPDAADATPTGIAIELWERVAERLELDYGYQEVSLEELITGLGDDRIDVSVAALTATAERAERVDFTHPYYSTGLSIAVPQQGNPVAGALRAFISVPFLMIILALAGLLLLVGALLWLFERHRNADEFGGSSAQGLGSAFWWAAVTMTTVGYGDKAPRTLPGRAIALVWMFAALILVSTFTAAIATTLTVSSLDTGIQNVSDLEGQRIATIGGSSAAAWLDDQGFAYRDHADLSSALDAVANGHADAMVYDAPLLRYQVREHFGGQLEVLPVEFLRQDYALALPQGSPLRAPMNVAILEILESDEWQRVLRRYLGN